jgi:hypothetical protein
MAFVGRVQPLPKKQGHSGEHLKTLRRDRPYERLNITGIRGLTEAQMASLRALGAVENLDE